MQIILFQLPLAFTPSWIYQSDTEKTKVVTQKVTKSKTLENNKWVYSCSIIKLDVSVEFIL